MDLRGIYTHNSWDLCLLGNPSPKNIWHSPPIYVRHIPTTSGYAKLSLEVDIAVFLAFRPKKRFFSLIFALSWSSLFCHEVLVDYLAAFTNPTEINWNTTTETHDWLPWTLWKKPLKLKGISLVKTDLKWKRNHMPRVSNLCWQEMLAARNISPPCVHCYCHSPQMVKHVYVRSNFPNMPK